MFYVRILTTVFMVFGLLISRPHPIAAQDKTSQLQSIDQQHVLTVVTEGFHQQKVKLYGIDIPDEGQPFGIAATRRLKRLTLHPFRIETLYQDDQGRAVAMIILHDGTTLNQKMVAQGYAWVDNKLCRHKMCSSWMNDQISARQQKLGLWSQDNPLPPWQWRKKHP